MRPIRIEMRAFSCYADRQVIDFTELGEGKLFLIHGPTGSGKSTLLDAVSFALYGESSGDERKPTELRSHLSDMTEETLVTFEFAVGSKRYRVQRSPEQEVQGKRGVVRRFETRATIWDQSEIVDDSEGPVLATKPRAVNDKIIEILGFSAEQFRQLIVIPQGQFRRLLLADVKERKGILETLFQASDYRAIEWRLKERAGALARDIRTQRDKRDGLLQHHKVESPQQVLEKMSCLKEVVRETQSRQDELKERIERQKKLQDQAADIDKKFIELDEADAIVKKLDVEREVMSDLERRVKLYERAAPLISIDKSLGQLAIDITRHETRSANLSSDVSRLKEKKDAAEQALRVEESRSEERKELDARLAKLGALEPVIIEFERANEELQRSNKVATEAKDKLINLEISDKTAKNELDELAKREVGLMAKVGRLDVLPTQLEAIRKEIRDRRALGAALRDEANARAAYERESNARDLSQREVTKTEDHEKRIRQIWADSRSAALAKSLEPHKPCPVCGSTHHPAPRTSDDAVLSDDDLSKARRSVEDARRALAQRDDSLLKAQGALSAAEGRVESLRESLKEIGDQLLADLVSKQDSYEQDLEICNNAKIESDALEHNKTKLINNRNAIIGALEDAIKEEDDARNKLAQSQTRVDVLREQIPPDIASAAELKKLKESIERKIEEANQALSSARNTSIEISKALAAVSATLNEVKATLDVNRAQLDKGENELAEKSSLCGITSRDELRIIVANYEQLDQMRKDLDLYNKKRAAADDRLKRAVESLPQGDRPNLEEINTQLMEIQRGFESSIEAMTSATGELATLENLIISLNAIDFLLKSLEDEYAIAGRIAAIAEGSNTLKMSYQSYVLASRLENVLSLATARLKRMSRGRYEMHRSMEVGDRRQEGGLAIEILDHYSGSKRSVATLSGGESFLASLSLALGLADAVQAHAGGIQMETIFIDEGFGTLDPEALEMAFQALNDLQSGGRLVGVISHVPDLKEMIKSRLEVAPGARGSRARFVRD